MGKTALIAGSTGQVGSNLLSLLIVDNTYTTVIALSRRPTGINHTKLNEIICSFDKMNEVSDQIKADDVFICLGSTMKKAGSKENFELFDYTYPLQIATIAKKNGAKQISIVSALGADDSSLFFYNRVKANLESAIIELNYTTTAILRPSLLISEREDSRIAENIAQGFYQALGWAFIGPIKKYKAIEVTTVATAMHKIAQSDASGINIFDSEQIEAIK